MTEIEEVKRRWCENPFFVLGLPPDAPRAEVERTAQKLIAELALDRAQARVYATPFGEAERTADLVRAAVAELRDPRKRLLHELRARMPLAAAPRAPDARGPWAGALAAMFGVAAPVRDDERAK